MLSSRWTVPRLRPYLASATDSPAGEVTGDARAVEENMPDFDTHDRRPESTRHFVVVFVLGVVVGLFVGIVGTLLVIGSMWFGP